MRLCLCGMAGLAPDSDRGAVIRLRAMALMALVICGVRESVGSGRRKFVPCPGLGGSRGNGLDGVDPFGWLAVIGRSRMVGGSPRPRLGVSQFWARGRRSWGWCALPPWLAGPPDLSIFAHVKC